MLLGMSSSPRSRRTNPQKTEGSKLLREWRAGRSQFEVATLLTTPTLQCDPSRISLLENGKCEPSIDLAVALRDVAGIPVDAWTKPLEQQEERVA